MKNIVTLILAAGASRRLGRPKQLVKIDGTELLVRTIQAAHAAKLSDLLVVTGARQEAVQALLESVEIPIQTVHNPHWRSGMASSITTGVSYCQQHFSHAEGILILVCDQAALHPDIIRRVVDVFHPIHQPIVYSTYRTGGGPPVCFAQSLFPELLKIEGDLGAKSVIKAYREQSIAIDFPAGDWDIDEEADLLGKKGV